ncbi:hypothetical protein DERP_008285 [Dermatophagoides pteronyssinus]|uniref:Insulin-like domain-containing protein n=1 Tax=Dermatophagoides pteronyssinus TaxID=6956 RepID=A0ABQ8J660_DERPT|nr:hypothetical protein DERP_008285 [Dermatophagoides pteronyssinus]
MSTTNEKHRKSKLLSIITLLISCLCHLINVNNSNYGVMANLSNNENGIENNVGETLFPIYSSDSTATEMVMTKSNNDINNNNNNNMNRMNFDNYETINSLVPMVSSSSSSLLSSSALLSSPINIETRGAEKQHYCGENLIKALALYCKGYYANKRTSGLSNINPNHEETYDIYSIKDCRNEPYTMNSNSDISNNGGMIDMNQLSLANNDNNVINNKNYKQNNNNNNNNNNWNELTWSDILNILKYSHNKHDQQQQQQQNQQSLSYLNNNNNKNKINMKNTNQGYLNDWWLDSFTRTHNNNYNHRIQRPKRGIVDECCKRPCGLKTLNQYCGIRKRPTY